MLRHPLIALIAVLLSQLLSAQEAVLEKRVRLYPGAFLDLERGVVLNVSALEGIRADLRFAGAAEMDADRSDKGAGYRLEPLGGAGIGRLLLEQRVRFEQLFDLSSQALGPDPLGIDGELFALVRTIEGNHAKLWCRLGGGGALEVDYQLAPGGSTRLPAPPGELQVSFAGGRRQVSWRARAGARYRLRRHLSGAPEELALDLAASPWFDREAPADRAVLYSLARLLGGGGESLRAQALSPPLGLGWSGSFVLGERAVDLYEGGATAGAAHLRLVRAFAQGIHVLPGAGLELRDGRGVRSSGGLRIVPDFGYQRQQLYLPLGQALFARTREGYVIRLTLRRLRQLARDRFEPLIEYEIAPRGESSFVVNPPADLVVRFASGAATLRWEAPGKETVIEVGRRGGEGDPPRVLGSSRSGRFEDPAVQLGAFYEYAIRRRHEGGRVSRWSRFVGVAALDPADEKALAQRVEAELQRLRAGDPAGRAEAERHLEILGEDAAPYLERWAGAGGALGEIARRVLERARRQSSREFEVRALDDLRQRLGGKMPGVLLAAGTDARRGLRLWAVAFGAGLLEPGSEALALLRAELQRADPDPLVRQVATWLASMTESGWGRDESARRSPPPPREVSLYRFSREDVRQLVAGGVRDAERIARWIESWVGAGDPEAAWTLLSLAEMARGGERAGLDLVEAGLKLLAGERPGSERARQVGRLVAIGSRRAQCRALGRLAALWEAGVQQPTQTLYVRAEEGIGRVQSLLDEAVPGTVILLAKGRYGPAAGTALTQPLRIARPGVRLQAEEAGEVRITAALQVEGARRVELCGLVLAPERGYALQGTDAGLYLEDVRLEGSGAGVYLSNCFAVLRRCRALGSRNSIGIMLRASRLVADACLFDGFQSAIQLQAPAVVRLTRCVLADIVHAAVRGGGQRGEVLYADRCVVAGSARYGFSNLADGAVARIVLAGVGAAGIQLGEDLRYDPDSVEEIEVTEPDSWDRASAASELEAWFR